MSDKKLLKVKVRDSENIIFEGEVDRVSSYNEVGRFDVYPLHANFISIIGRELALYNQSKVIKELKLEQAVMKVKEDIVHIFLGIEALLLEDTGHSAKDQPKPQAK